MRHIADLRHEVTCLRLRARNGWEVRGLDGLDVDDALKLCDLAEEVLDELDRALRLLEDFRRRIERDPAVAL